MELKKLVKNTSFLMGSSFIQFLAGVIRSKLSAILLGTTGIGIINQLNFLTQNTSQLTSLGMSDAVAKQIAENSSSKNIRDIICSSLKSFIALMTIFMILSLSLLLLFSEHFSFYTFGDIKYIKYFYIGALCLPFLLFTNVPYAILKGFKNSKAISQSRVVSIIINLIIFVPLILIYKLKGAVIFVPIYFFNNLVIYYYFVNKIYFRELNIRFKDIITASINKLHLKELLIFSSLSLILTISTVISDFLCRSIVVTNLGVDKLGLYSPIITWAGLFTSFLLPSLSTYLYPRFCETKTNGEVSGVLNDAFRLSTFSLLPLLFLGIPFREFFIELFYSSKFLEASIYLPFHFLGVVFNVWFYIFSQSMTPKGKIKQHVFFMVLFNITNVLLTYILVPRFGLNGWMLKFFVVPFLFFLVYYMYIKSKMDFILILSNLFLMLFIVSGSVILITVSFYDNMLTLNYLFGIILILLTYFFLKDTEKTIIKDKLARLYSNNK